MFATKIPHVSLSKRNGYVWRKSYKGKYLYIALRTRNEQEAISRGVDVSVRFLDLSSLSIPYDAIYQSLKSYRDEIVRHVTVSRLTAIKNAYAAPQALYAPLNHQATQLHQQAVDVPQKSVQALTGHTLAETKKAFFEANTEWKDRTLTEYSVNIDKFVKWAISKKVFNVEDVTKTHIIEFKAYMDKQGFAPNTKQKVLTRLGSMFKFAVDVKEWLPKNPITGMMYKKVGVVNKKEEITPEQFNQALSDDDLQTYWAMNLLYHCGLRVSELSQLTKNDYREIEGIKYISINSDDNKTVKNESSIRNIPLNKALLALGVSTPVLVPRTF